MSDGDVEVVAADRRPRVGLHRGGKTEGGLGQTARRRRAQVQPGQLIVGDGVVGVDLERLAVGGGGRFAIAGRRLHDAHGDVRVRDERRQIPGALGGHACFAPIRCGR